MREEDAESRGGEGSGGGRGKGVKGRGECWLRWVIIKDVTCGVASG